MLGVVGGEIRCFGGGVGRPWARCRLRRLSVICELWFGAGFWCGWRLIGVVESCAGSKLVPLAALGSG